MSVMLERMAEAFVDAMPVPEGINPQFKVPWARYDEPERERLLIGMRAAVEAMRDPNIAMYDFGTDKMWKDRNSTEVWQSMIDGALS